ncbi:MAG: universal stress protein [Lentisphaerales bacterium]|nr:universal stress protein [Lentisphaerales bacterium]
MQSNRFCQAARSRNHSGLCHRVHPLLPVLPYYPYNEKQFREDCYNKINKRIDEQKETFKAAGVKVNNKITNSGKAYEVICNAADKIGACAIIVGVGEHFILENLIGSTTEKVTRLAKQNVMVINPLKQGDIHKILCAYDFTESADATLEKTVNIDRLMNAELDILHFIQESAYKTFKNAGEDVTLTIVKANLLQATQKIRDSIDITINCHVRKGKPAFEICDFAKTENTELLVIGASGNSAITRLFLGSNSSHVLRKAPCSIMITRLTQEANMSNFVSESGYDMEEKYFYEAENRNCPRSTSRYQKSS